MDERDQLISDIGWKELEVTKLEERLIEAKQSIQQIGDAKIDLSNEVAERRAANQSSTSGFLSGFLGPKYRASVRRAATASNAEITQYAARRRIELTELQRQIRETEREIRALIAVAKSELRDLQRQLNQAKGSTHDAISLLKKLKEAHELGLLTDNEFEEKRKALVAKI